MRTSTKLTSLVSAAVLSLTLTACGSGDDAVTVGSKDFTENILLGEMLLQALEAEGIEVEDKIDLGGTEVNRGALTSGDIDVYPEYNGTGWTVHLGQEDPSSDPTELYTVTAEKDLADNEIKWVGLSPFNDTYGFAANGDLSASDGPFDLQGMADYLEATPDATVCLETEFPDRPDGLVLFEDATGYELPESQQQILDTGLIYTETSDGACDFGEVFTTDGRITELNLELVEDPGVFILYNVSYTMPVDVYDANAEIYDEVVETILAGLDNEKMASLNAQVDVDGVPASDVAAEYLTEVGIL
ncbi:glycine betaine ABC transporter substrate-binding protein [Nocardioides sp.]|uniref:glycine betaine ABC transporter substrate-binding protein n=1 Tax=Nocardioides sp. TaxID=35761 RepID=UPI002B27AED1|nr:glycine betaine ABC transporter substrate-binding protein [Nocardioides sp.]